jgi:uncharacterized membrane-anchored protein YitT (DUF2179 family)
VLHYVPSNLIANLFLHVITSLTQEKTMAIKLVLLTLANVLYAATVTFILIPNHYVDGGIVGVSIIIHYYTNWPTSIVFFIFNIPIFALAWRFLSRTTIYLSLYAIFIMTISLRAFEAFTPMQHGPIATCLFAGVCIGFSLGIIFLVGATTGGIDILAMIVWQKWRLRIPLSLFVMDVIIVGSSLLYISMQRVTLTLAFLLLSAAIIDLITHLPNATKTG